jgi:hypothetical protein
MTLSRELSPPLDGYDYLRLLRNDSGRPQREFVMRDGQVIPRDRLRTKGSECADCVEDERCGGFYESYVRHRLLEFRPIPRS